MTQQLASPVHTQPHDRLQRRWQTYAAVVVALSLGLASPLACILHCLTFEPIGAQPSANPRVQLICLLRGREHPSPGGAPHAARVPPALYQLAPALNQPSLVIVALALALALSTYQLAPQFVIAPPTPPPRPATAPSA